MTGQRRSKAKKSDAINANANANDGESVSDSVSGAGSATHEMVDRHLRAGWWGLAVFVVLGSILELLHAVKAPSYLDAGRETTRLLLRLAHAHGTLLSVVNLAFAFTVRARPATSRPLVSPLLLASLVLLPGGFLIGGLWAHGGDPGLGVILVPPGALALVIAAIVVARSVTTRREKR